MSKPQPPRLYRRPPVPWEVLEVHLEDATFLLGQWEQSLWAPDSVLEELETGEERRLLAHLDGLVLGGRPAAERLLLPALEGDEAAGITVAALALLGVEEGEWHKRVLGWLAEGAEDVVADVRRAVELSPREDLSPALLGLLPEVPADRRAHVIAALRFRQADLGEALAGLRLEAGTPLLAEAVRATRFMPRAGTEALLRLGLMDAEPSVRDSALEAGLVLGRREAWARCRQLLAEGGQVSRLALLALAMGGEGRDLEALVAALGEPTLRDEVLWALGFSGRLAAADAVFQVLSVAGDRLAAESFAAITGLPLAPPFLVEEEEDDAPSDEDLDEDFDEEKGPQDAPEGPAAELLPGPVVLPGKVVVERVEKWWAEARRRFEPGGRYLRGQPLTVDVLRAALEAEPLRRRAVLAWELAIRSKGACQVESRAWTYQQRRQARGAAGLRPDVLTRPFERLLG